MHLQSWQLLLCPEPPGEPYSAPPDPLADMEGLAAPSLRTPPPLSAFGLEFRPFVGRLAELFCAVININIG